MRLAAAVADLSRRAGGRPSETLELVDLPAKFDGPGAVAAFWDAVASCEGVQVRLVDHLQDEIPFGEQPSGHSFLQPFRVVLTKPTVPGRAFFLTIDGLRDFLASAALEGLPPELLVADSFVAFATGTTRVGPWDAASPTMVTLAVVGDVPRKLVRDLSSDLVPRSAACWTVFEGEIPVGLVGDAFANAAAKTLPFTLVTEAWRQDHAIHVSVRGDRTVTLVAPLLDRVSREGHAALNAAAAWVYGHPDAEVRHTLLANEIAREWRDGETWTDTPAVRLGLSLRQAKVAYGHHLRAQAKDAIKSLTDLRKAVGEEVEKAATQTRDLVATLWRDFAVAAGAIAVRLIAVAPGSTTNGRATGFLLLGTAAFVAYSFVLSVWLNRRFHRHAKQLRRDWHGRLYGFLGPEEFENLATRPLEDVRRSYRAARAFVAVAYTAVVVILVWTASQALISGPSLTYPSEVMREHAVPPVHGVEPEAGQPPMER